MTLNIELPKDLEEELSTEADRLGLPLTEYALRVLSSARSFTKPSSGAEIVAYWRDESLIGSRPDIADSQSHARELRDRAERRR